MRKLMMGLALVGLLMAAGSAFAVTTGTATINLYGMENYIAAPLIPFDAQPVYMNTEGNLVGCFVDWAQLYDGTGDALYTLDPLSQNRYTWNSDWPIGQAAILAGEAYKAWAEGYTPYGTTTPVRTFSFSGVNIADTDLWISLPGLDPAMTSPPAPWEHWVGINYPTDKSVPWANIVITNGSEAYTMLDVYSGTGGGTWFDYNFYWKEPSTQNSWRIPDDGYVYDVQGGQGYRVFTNVRNLALIVPAPGI